MKRLILIFLLSSPIWAEELCGPSDGEVCLSNSTAVGFECFSFQPGSILWITLPSLNNGNGPNNITGNALEPHWFALEGYLNDSTGGTWSAPFALHSDDRGARAIGFELLSGVLNGAVSININQIKVCQLVSDGPSDVLLEIYLYGLSNNSKTASIQGNTYQNPGFQSCNAYSDHPPLAHANDQLFIVNPHQSKMLINIDGQDQELLPNQQISLSGGKLQFLNCSQKPGALIMSPQGDLGLTPLPQKDQTAWFLPHLAQDTTLWQNSLVLASPSSGEVSMSAGSNTSTKMINQGLNIWSPELEAGEARFANLQAETANNATLFIQRKDGVGGSALLSPLDQDSKGIISGIIPHVAADNVNFWTGFSLANDANKVNSVTLTSYNQDGSHLQTETIEMQPYSSYLGVIGDTILTEGQPSWVLLTSSQAFQGTVIFGGKNENNPTLCGLALAGKAATTLVYPKLTDKSGEWNGLAVLNPSNQKRVGTISEYDTNGTELNQVPVSLEAGEKQTFLLTTANASHAIYRGQPLVGIGLMGDDNRSQLGGYLAIQVE